MVEYPIASATGQGVPPSVSHERRHILLYRGRLGIRTSIAVAVSTRAGGPVVARVQRCVRIWSTPWLSSNSIPSTTDRVQRAEGSGALFRMQARKSVDAHPRSTRLTDRRATATRSGLFYRVLSGQAYDDDLFVVAHEVAGHEGASAHAILRRYVP